MDNKIIFLGTAGDSIVAGKQYRGTGGILIQAEDYQFLVDPGPGTLNQAKLFGINLRNITAVISTHNHVNHANDVNAVINSMTHGGIDRQGVFIGNKTVIEGEDIHKPTLSEVHRNYVERVILLRPGQKVGIGSIELKAVKAYHSDPNTIGLQFVTPKFIVTYSSDTRYEADLIEEYQKSDILILNTVYPFDSQYNDQLNCSNAVEILEKVKPKLCIITHFGVKLLNSDPMFIAREIQKKSGVQVIAARDSMALNPISLKQI